MADTDTKKVWVNTLIDEEDVVKLDAMVKENGATRAAFIRLLIDNEWESRQRRDEHVKKLLQAAKVKRPTN